MNWHYDWQRQCWVAENGRRVTDEQLKNMDPFAAGMLRQVLQEQQQSKGNNSNGND